ncbi:ABC transporter substrate-binding protein [Streptomyces sp. CA-111067]|uniref:ABC transporter substrate-binding protein n=1 Tax=Streptomyces sp. CA-111067 TaxID=3240046 RepID=UPI003D967725
MRARLRTAAAVAALALLAAVGGCSGTRSAAGGSVIVADTGGGGLYTHNFNPFAVNAASGTRGFIYEPLFFFNNARKGAPVPQLGTAYAFSDHGKVLDLTLRKHVTWSDGKPFGSADVAFTFDLIRRTPSLNTGGLDLTAVRATDADHVRLTFRTPAYVQLPVVAGQTMIVPAHLWKGVGDPSTWANSKPVGTGPFVLRTFSPQAVTLMKNPSYWEQGKPAIDGVRYILTSGNSASDAGLRAGTTDWGGVSFPGLKKNYLDRSSDNHITTFSLATTDLLLNLGAWPGNDLAVRQAVSLGLDRERIYRLGLEPTSVGGYQKASPVQMLRPAFSSAVSPAYRGLEYHYDPATARSTLLKAGYTMGGDGFFRDRTGRRLSIPVEVVSGYTDVITMAQVMAQQLRQVGIDFTIRQASATSVSTDFSQGRYTAQITNVYGGTTPYYAWNQLLNSALTAPVGKPAVGDQIRFRNPEVDAALAGVRATDPADTAALQAYYDRIQKVLVEQQPVIGLLQSVQAGEYSTARATGYPTAADLYAVPVPWSAPDAAIVAKNLKPAS